MTTISSVNSSYSSNSVPSSTGVSALQHQIEVLQGKCAEWNACPTTPAPEKQKQIAMLTSQIQSIQMNIEKARDVSTRQASKKDDEFSKVVINKNNETNPSSKNYITKHENANNPLIGERIGGNINLSV